MWSSVLLSFRCETENEDLSLSSPYSLLTCLSDKSITKTWGPTMGWITVRNIIKFYVWETPPADSLSNARSCWGSAVRLLGAWTLPLPPRCWSHYLLPTLAGSLKHAELGLEPRHPSVGGRCQANAVTTVLYKYLCLNLKFYVYLKGGVAEKDKR